MNPSKTDETLAQRKRDHIDLCRTHDVEGRRSGFESLSLMPCAVPELDLSEIQTDATFMGHNFSAPLLITGMTGGIREGHEINRRLAKAAQAFRIPMGVGSQRIALEDPRHRSIFTLKNEVPSVFLIGNLGLAEVLDERAVDTCQSAVDMIQADALAIHLNVLQECVQEDGSRRFRGFLNALEKISKKLTVPVMIKEVGCGISAPVARKLIDAGAAVIDCGGRGGTSWPYIEGLRAKKNPTRSMGELFRDWGIPTAFNIAQLREAFPHTELVATGGLRDGVKIAKALSLGATMTGIGLPLLRAAMDGEEILHEVLREMIHQLRITMLATGSESLIALRGKAVWGDPYEQECYRLLTGSVTTHARRDEDPERSLDGAK